MTCMMITLTSVDAMIFSQITATVNSRVNSDVLMITVIWLIRVLKVVVVPKNRNNRKNRFETTWDGRINYTILMYMCYD